MARREVLVQLDDRLVDELDRLAAVQGTSRSDLVRRSVLALLDPPDPVLVEAARRLAAGNTPSW